jgi:hypothetical protein
MAKVQGPLHSLDARGSFGLVRFRRTRGGGVHVYHDGSPGSRRRVRPSANQLTVRSRYSAIRAEWGTLSAEGRQVWNDQAAVDERLVSGWNLFLASRMLEQGQVLEPHLLLSSGEPLLLEGHTGVLKLEDEG